MANTYTLISSNILGTTASSVTFSSIPQTYTDLVFIVNARGSDFAQPSESVNITFSGDTGSNYSYTRFNNTAGAAASTGSSNGQVLTLFRSMDGSGATANAFGSIEVYIPSYTNSQYKPILSSAAPEEGNTSSFYNVLIAGLWRNTSAVTSILIAPNNSTAFVTGSSFYLYGISNS